MGVHELRMECNQSAGTLLQMIEGIKMIYQVKNQIGFGSFHAAGWSVSNTLDLENKLGRPEIVRRFHSPNWNTLHIEKHFQILSRWESTN